MHAAIIMDGNGRWAQRRGQLRPVGHRAGAEAVRRVVEAAPALGITQLTLFALSSDNWRRSSLEIAGIMALLRHYLHAEIEPLRRAGVRLTVIGRRDRLPESVQAAIAAAETQTAAGRQLHLRLAIDYSARAAIEDSIRRGTAQKIDDVDLLIRTGGEQRLSDFLLWECAYAELWFTDCLWPDFGATELRTALEAFRHRERRFGAVTPQLVTA